MLLDTVILSVRRAGEAERGSRRTRENATDVRHRKGDARGTSVHARRDQISAPNGARAASALSSPETCSDTARCSPGAGRRGAGRPAARRTHRDAACGRRVRQSVAPACRSPHSPRVDQQLKDLLPKRVIALHVNRWATVEQCRRTAGTTRAVGPGMTFATASAAPPRPASGRLRRGRRTLRLSGVSLVISDTSSLPTGRRPGSLLIVHMAKTLTVRLHVDLLRSVSACCC